MTMTIWILAVMCGLLIVKDIWATNTRDQEIQVTEGRRVMAVASHDQVWKSLVDGLVKDARERELSLRSEIQTLTEAIARSKENIQIVYPRDPSQPLEPSPGWYDAKPELRSNS